MDTASAETVDSTCNGLYRIGGAAALVAAIVFRRNLAAEIGLFGTQAPGSVVGWFALLQSNRLIGLAFLNVFDLADYALVGLMFLALYAALHRAGKCASAIATVCGFVGIAAYFASNTALTMLSLSDQYAAATSEAERSMLLAAGRAALALNQGTGYYVSLFLLAVAGLVFSVLMLRSAVFGRATAWVGLLAGALDLAYCAAFPFVSAAGADLVAVCTLPAAGLLLMIWHILIGLKLSKLARLERKTLPQRS
jgi:hypothetical protein